MQDAEDISRVVAGEIAALIRQRQQEGTPCCRLHYVAVLEWHETSAIRSHGT